MDLLMTVRNMLPGNFLIFEKMLSVMRVGAVI